MKNYQRRWKFDPYFLPEPFTVIDVEKSKITVKRNSDDKQLIRHPDDIEIYKGEFKSMNVRDSSFDDDTNNSYGTACLRK